MVNPRRRSLDFPRAQVALAIVALIVVGGVVAAWLVQSTSATGDAYRVRVLEQGRLLASFDLAALEAVGAKDVVLQGKNQHGPALLDVLTKAGVRDFASLEIRGAGVKDSGILTLRRAEIGRDVVLAIAQRGTVKVAGPNIPMAWRVRDVTELIVR